jgi:DMSO reductase family type II enzyme heme b subunit
MASSPCDPQGRSGIWLRQNEYLVPGPVAVIAVFLTAGPALAQEHPGKPVYDRWCAECHGMEGRGDGPAATHMLPRPRDFTEARYQIRTTASGELPTDADMMRVIERGMPGTAMPGWPKLSTSQKTDLIAYLKTFSRFFESEAAPEPIDVGRAPRASSDAIEEGRQLYDRLECWKCHGRAGRGDGASAPTQTDDNDMPIRPADLSQNWRFNGGGTVEDIHMRLRTGLDGTPMPSSSDLIAANVVTEDQLWNVAHYVRSLSPEKTPEAREIVRAVLRTGELPTTPGDEAWSDVPAAYIPLVGQIIERPRWFVPTVRTIWVQAVHNGEELALRLVWNDPSRSPDAAWDDWRQLIAEAMEPKDEPPAEGALPDAVAVQFPAGAVTGRDLPYFLMGDARTPVHLWRWSSDGAVRELTARGLDSFEPLSPASGAVVGDAAWADGQWQLVLRRSLASGADDTRPALRTGEPIPFALFAWDGSNGEAGKRGAIGSWYFLFLEQPATAAVYVVPILTILITALLGFAAVRYAQRAQRQGGRAPAAGVVLTEP